MCRTYKKQQNTFFLAVWSYVDIASLDSNPNPEINASLIPTPPTWSPLSFTVTRLNTVPESKSGKSVELSPSTSSKYIYAYSSTPPSDLSPSSADPKPKIHDNYDSFEYTFSSSSNSKSSARVDSGSSAPLAGFGPFKNSRNVNFVHGVLMSLAWIICPFIGIFIARYMKDKLGVWWFRLHMLFLLGGTGGLSVISFLMKFLTAKPPHFESVHGVSSYCTLLFTFHF